MIHSSINTTQQPPTNRGSTILATALFILLVAVVLLYEVQSVFNNGFDADLHSRLAAQPIELKLVAFPASIASEAEIPQHASIVDKESEPEPLQSESIPTSNPTPLLLLPVEEAATPKEFVPIENVKATDATVKTSCNSANSQPVEARAVIVQQTSSHHEKKEDTLYRTSELHPRFPAPPALLKPSERYYDPLVTPLLQQYIQMHSWAALETSSTDSLCTHRQWIVTPCCAANYGSTLFRVLAVLKLAIQTNRTFVARGDAYNLQMYFNFPFATHEQVKTLLLHRNCLLSFEQNLWKPPTMHEIHFEKVASPPSQTPWIFGKEDQEACEGYEPPSDDTPLATLKKKGTELSVNVASHELRCSVLRHKWLKTPILRVFAGDDFHFLRLLELNPFFRSDPTLEPLFPHVLFNRSMSSQMLDLFFQPAASIAAITQELTRGIPFHFYVHLRGTTKKENAEWDRLPAVESSVTAMLELLRDSNSDIWKEQQPIWDEAAAGADFAPLPTVVRSNASSDGVDFNPPLPIRLFISSAYTPAADLCKQILQEFRKAITLLQAKEEEEGGGGVVAKWNPRVECVWFDAATHRSVYGLHPNLIHFQREARQDWGSAPEWAAVVNMFMARFISREIFTLTYSRFGQLLGVIAKKPVSGHVEKIRHVEPYFWPF